MKRRLLSAFLAVMMVLTMAPVAFAADEEAENTADGSASVGASAKTLQQQIDGIKGTGTVTLDQDYTEDITIQQGQNITLDLNGKKLTNVQSDTITVTKGAKLTIEGAGTVDNVTHAKSALVNYGEVVLNNGVTLERSSEKGTLSPYSDGGNSCYTILNDKGATMTINNATVKNSGGYSSAIRNGGDSECNDESHLTIKDGNFSGGLNAVKNDECGILTIDGGTFSNTSQYVIMNWNKATITNGTFSVKDSADAVLFTAAYQANRAVGELIVNNGTFTGKGSQKMVENHYGSSYTGTASITGGTFSSDVSAYCDANYATEKNTDNTYTVKPLKDVAVAKIGNTYYKSLVDAYAALPRGEGAAPSEPTTITLLKDSDGGGIGSDKTDNYMNYVIDFNGHTYTVGAPAVGSTGTVSQGIRVLKTSTAKFMNGTLKAANYNQLVQVVHTYGDVTFQDFTVDATEDQYAQIAYEVDNGTLNIKGNSNILAYNGQTGLYVAFWPRGGYTGGTTVNVDTTGKITGKMVYEWDDKADTAEQQTENKAVLNIKNGNFDITNIQTLFTSSLPSNLKVPKIYISGGYFTTDPSAYVASGYVAGTSDVSGYSYKVVAKTNTGNVEVKPDVADPEVKVSGSISKEDQAKVAAAAATVSAPTLGAAAVDEAQKINEDKAKELLKDVNVGDGDKKLYVQSSLKVEPTAYDAANKTLALEITPQYRVVASTATTADKIKLDGDTNTKNAQVVQDYQNMTIDTPTEVTMELPTGFAVADGDKLSIQHTKNDTVEYYTGTVTKKDDKFYLTFTTNGFSPFVIAVPEASIGENVYPTLQAAVDSVESGKTIKLEQAVAANTKVTVAKTIKFTVDTNSMTFAKENIAAGANTTVKVTGDASPYTYEFTYTKPSSSSSGGSSSGKTTYKVTTSAVNNGGVNASPSNAEKGATITITLSPDKGYKLDKLTVTDGSGKTVSTVKKSDTVYTFTMPASAVKVGVSYVKATETPSKTKFNDVSANDWFASAVDYVTGKGMMNGTADNTFSPKANTTRGMVVTVLYRLEHQPSTSAASFTDVASGAYYANAVAWANANGIVSGYGSGKFGPNDKVTREQLAAILYRYAQYKKYDVSGAKSLDGYTDAQSVSSYAVPALQWANAAGVVTGKSGNKLDPKGNATRAEVAAMLMRFCENVK